MYKRKINGIVHDESASGKTFFIEPAEVVEANNRLRELSIEEHREIVRILTALADTIRPEIDDLLGNFELLGLFDFIHAKAKYAMTTGGTMPYIDAARSSTGIMPATRCLRCRLSARVRK